MTRSKLSWVRKAECAGVLLIATVISQSQAATLSCVSTAGGGNWNNTAVWSGCGGAFPNNGANTYNATVAASTVTLNTTATVSQLTVNSGATLNLGTNLLDVLGSYTLQGAVTSGNNIASGATLNGPGTYLTGGTVTNVVNNATIAFVGTSGAITRGAGGTNATYAAGAGVAVSLDHATLQMSNANLAGAGTFNAINLQNNFPPSSAYCDLCGGVNNNSTLNLVSP